MSVGLVVLGVVLFVLLIIVHEAGHFIVARRNHVDVEEFGIFFPPRLWSRKTKAGWEFSINLLPLGGFVRLKGEHDEDKGKGTYGSAKLGSKAKILLAGVTMNVVVAFLLLTLLGWVGLPKLINNQFTIKSDTHVSKNEILIGSVIPGSPAAKAGLETTDQLTKIISSSQKIYKVTSADNLPSITKSLAGQTVTVDYTRDKQQHSERITLLSQKIVLASQKTKNPKGYLGISPTQYTLYRYTWSSPVVALGILKQFTVLTFKGLGSVVAGLARGNTTQATSQVTGPVGIFEILKDGSLLGYQFVLIIVAVISLSLAIMNILPIPALDGGKLFVTLVARVLRKKLTAKIENALYGAGFALLIVLIILITIVDVRRNF
ncbi:MAG TPA: M50 family metallopeptidase [Patescibacteria group bacterium]|jgi:regulator of sigma E protease|nr:M50 family metallopeptidase [Patescibacteria group bacterium]